MTAPQQPPVTPGTPPPARPPDVDTGFWLWVVALPLMTAAHVIDVLTLQQHANALVLAFSLVFVFIVFSVVLVFQFLMRQGYRWARTLLTGGAIAAVVFSVSTLFTAERGTGWAVAYAVCVIFGSVLIAGGVYLLHRKESHDFFQR
ncbi:hypothetical protein MPRF_06500 [Mycolicibacterium parafortuitum]|uniref:Uncharacterized protein n=2 Tax=Mycolicibacterium parafortuitum TaxID=39692 RepID=A0A375YFS8_MYCPF|nr:hypothetical protein [Mycolicibacterium parafortuitum]PQE01625.1 hypothetical protein CYL16_06065 [Mycobacterium sp. EPG1]BBY73751.1 hypothetical protein MPRF_06500 [Mycolicibacterium parafortuitum]SRX79950.1 hypothetical protein MPP7335_01688 [Mycolicibacterium parafortuitum]